MKINLNPGCRALSDRQVAGPCSYCHGNVVWFDKHVLASMEVFLAKDDAAIVYKYQIFIRGYLLRED